MMNRSPDRGVVDMPRAFWSRGVMRAVGLVVVAACGAVLKPPEPDRRLNVQVTGTMFESDRGYRFAVLPDDAANVVRVDVRYPVGSIDDPPGKEGLAHLVEHLLFEIEIERDGKPTSIDAELGKIALAWNAETHTDYTVYEVLAAPDALDAIIQLETERLAVGCKGITPEIFAREREVVRNELRERQGTRGAALSRALLDQVYPANHPYRRVDSIDSVAKLELDDACKFLAGPYMRGKATIAVSGAVDGPTLQAAAANHMGTLRKRMLVARPVPPVATPQPGTVRIKADVDEPLLIATWPLPPHGTRDARMLDLISSRIALRLEDFAFTFKWGRSAFTTVLGGPQAPVLAVGIELDSTGKLDEAIGFMEKATKYPASSIGVDKDGPRWLDTWQTRAEQLLARWESLSGRAAMFEDFLDSDHNREYLVGRIAELTEASPDNVRDLADHWLSPSRARYILLEPSGAPTARAGGGYRENGAEEHATAVDGALADKPMRTIPRIKRLATIRYTLPNGLSVILWPNGTAPLVHGRLVIDAGSAHEPAGKAGLSLLVGASEVHPDSMVFGGRYLSTRVDELVGDLALELRVPGSELTDEAKDYEKALLRKKRVTEAEGYRRAVANALYGAGHPYTQGQITADTIGKMHRDLVTDWARGHVVPNNATLVIAGHFDPDLVKRHIAYNADQVAAGRASAPVPSKLNTRGRDYVRGIATRPSATVELDVGFVAGWGLDESYAKRLVLERILDAKLMRLRSQNAVTYGFSASYEPRRAGGMWQIGGDADANRAAGAAKTLLAVLDEIRKDAESYRTEFVFARQKVVEELVVTASDSSAIANRLELLARFHLPDDFFDDLVGEVARLTLADMAAFVRGELDADAQVFGAFGNADAVDAALAAAKSLQ